MRRIRLYMTTSLDGYVAGPELLRVTDRVQFLDRPTRQVQGERQHRRAARVDDDPRPAVEVEKAGVRAGWPPSGKNDDGASHVHDSTYGMQQTPVLDEHPFGSDRAYRMALR